MRLTSFTEYGLWVLVYAAVHADELVTVRQISAASGISRNHLVKIVHTLGQAGYLSTWRGRKGGLRLGRPAELITVGDVVRAMEPDFYMVECWRPERNNCVITAACGLRTALSAAMRVYFEVLDRCTLADLASGPDPLTDVLTGGSVIDSLVLHSPP
jgi:Rrf2 family nitric oxide-sensitive transcriptional repressor